MQFYKKFIFLQHSNAQKPHQLGLIYLVVDRCSELWDGTKEGEDMIVKPSHEADFSAVYKVCTMFS